MEQGHKMSDKGIENTSYEKESKYYIGDENDDMSQEFWILLLWGLINDVPKKEWDKFSHDLIYDNRFNSSHKVVDVIRDNADRRERRIVKGTKLYRARIYYQEPLWEFVSELFSEKSIEKNKSISNNAVQLDEYYNMQLAAVIMAIEKGASKDNAVIDSINKWGRKKFKGYNARGSGKAPVDKTSSGRINPKGISYLYLAEDPETSIYEVRPTIDQHVSVAMFKTTEEIRIYDLAEDSIKPDNKNMGDDDSLFEVIQRRFSEPNSGDTLRYVPTQYLGETIKQMGFDGIRFRSSLKKDGINIVLFDDNKCKAIRSDITKVSSINLEYANPDIYELESYVNSSYGEKG